MNWSRLGFYAFLTFSLWGQTGKGPAALGAGYEFPAPLFLAPGQLVTLLVYGIPITRNRSTDTDELPTSVNGITVTMEQLVHSPSGSRILRWHLPIQEVRWFGTCAQPLTSTCLPPTGGITVQIPFEMENAFADFSCAGCVPFPYAYFWVNVDGEGPVFMDIAPLPDRVHILRSYDSVLPINSNEPNKFCASYLNQFQNTSVYSMSSLPCPALVKHSDGSLVTAENPARAGEELVAWAVGLGRTTPATKTGQVVKVSAPTETTFALDFNFRRNALPTKPPPVTAGGDVPQASYTGTVEGTVGVYQVRFQVPPVPPETPPCAAIGTNIPLGANLVFTNLTVSIGGRYSFDGAGICVAVDNTAPQNPESPQ